MVSNGPLFGMLIQQSTVVSLESHQIISKLNSGYASGSVLLPDAYVP